MYKDSFTYLVLATLFRRFWGLSMPGSSVVEDALFKAITGLQASTGRKWGRFLDSGTGTHSLKWIRGLDTSGWTAVTADDLFAANTKAELNLNDAEAKNIVVGNWQNPHFLEGEVYDTILADYLIGAVDGFSPYFQDKIFGRLKEHLSPGGRIYVVGMQPVPDQAPGAAAIISEVAHLRDACILLASHRPYREYPLEWIERHLTREGFELKSSLRLSILHSEASVKRQLDVAAKKLPFFGSRDVASAMGRHIDEVGDRLAGIFKDAKGGRIQLGFDYVVAGDLPLPPSKMELQSGNPEEEPIGLETL